MEYLASAVNLSAQTLNLGTSRSLTSLVTVPIMTAVFPSLPFTYFDKRESEIGALLRRDIHNLFAIISANFEPVRLAMKLFQNKQIQINQSIKWKNFQREKEEEPIKFD